MKYEIFLIIFIISLICSIGLYNKTSCERGNFCGSSQNGYFGIYIFSFLSLITLIHLNKPTKIISYIINSGIIIGSIIAFYFLYLQHFVYNSYCNYCLIIDFGLLIALIILFYSYYSGKDLNK